MRRRLAWLAVLCALPSAALAEASPPWDLPRGDDGPSLHPSIHIVGDAEFEAPSRGVRSGRGTAEDPYVIRDWIIVGPRSPAILLQGTSAHVVIEQVIIDDRAAFGGQVLRCAQGELCVDIGIHLLESSNVTIRRVHVVHAFWGILATRSRDVLIEDSRFGGESPLPSAAADATADAVVQIGIGFTDSEHARVENASFPRTSGEILVTRGADITIARSTFHETPFGVTANGPIRGLGLIGNVVARGRVELGGSADFSELRIEGNTFDGGPWALAAFDAHLRDVSICGNAIRGSTEPLGAIYLAAADRVRLHDNSFESNRYAFEILAGSDVEVNRNRVANSTSPSFGAVVNVPSARVAANAFEGNVGGIGLLKAMDASGNWWGAPDGPSGLPGGSGDRLKTFGAAVIVEPWLSARPELPLACPT